MNRQIAYLLSLRPGWAFFAFGAEKFLREWGMQVTLNARLVKPLQAAEVERRVRGFFPLPVEFLYDEAPHEMPILAIKPDVVCRALEATDPDFSHRLALERSIREYLAEARGVETKGLRVFH